MGFNGALAQQQFCQADVRFGSKADIQAPSSEDINERDRHVRFVPIADISDPPHRSLAEGTMGV
jgi:hypothetical protein